MITLNPAESFPIVRLLKDHTDSTTYYVRAVIRDATTDAILDTVDLDSKGNRRFSKVWKVVYDNVLSRGRFIVITTSVYTDAGYTTLADTYGEEAETYLVEQRWNQGSMVSFGGGQSTVSGEKIDYEKIKKMIDESLEALNLKELEPLELPEPVDTESMIKEISMIIQNKIDSIEFPEQKNDNKDVISAINGLSKKVDTSISMLKAEINDEIIKENGSTRQHSEKKHEDTKEKFMFELKNTQNLLVKMLEELKKVTEESKTINLSGSFMAGGDTKSQAKKEFLSKLMSQFQ